MQGETGEAALLAAARAESRQEGGGRRGEYEKSWRNRTLRRGRAPHTVSRCTEGGHSSPEADFLKQREKGKRDLSWEGKGADCWGGDGNLVAGQSFRPDAALAARLVQSATGALHAPRGRRLPPPSTSLRQGTKSAPPTSARGLVLTGQPTLRLLLKSLSLYSALCPQSPFPSLWVLTTPHLEKLTEHPGPPPSRPDPRGPLLCIFPAPRSTPSC